MTPIYHITHIANLPAILREDGLLCDAEAERRAICAQSIAYDAIKGRRKRRRVENLQGLAVAAGGVVADYSRFCDLCTCGLGSQMTALWSTFWDVPTGW